MTHDSDTAHKSSAAQSGTTANLFDAIIIGGGPAGLTAALYLARARYRVLLVEKESFGGQIAITEEVANYPGAGLVSGRALTDTMRRQAEAFGAEFLLAEVSGLMLEGDVRTVQTNRGDYRAFGIILATGAHPRRVGFRGEEEYQGRGVAYCATCDGEFFSGQDIFVVGGGLAAVEEAHFLTKFARKVIMLVRGEHFRAVQSAVDKIMADPRVEVHFNSEVEEVAGDSRLELLRYRNNASGQIHEYRPPEGEGFGVFVFAGYAPATALVRKHVALDESGYVITDSNRKTSLDGVYAAGDVCVKNLRQVVTAVADGAIAATEMERWAADAQKRTGLVPSLPVASSPTSSLPAPSQLTFPQLAPSQDTPSQRTPSQRTPSQDTSCPIDPSKAPEDFAQPDGTSFFDEDMRTQLNTLFARMEQPVILSAVLNDQPISQELHAFLAELSSLTDKLSLVERQLDAHEDTALLGTEHTPFVEIRREDGQRSGIIFHGVPGGHETTSFVLGIYNASGSGQALDTGLIEQIAALETSTRLRVLVSLSCTNCPDVVQASQRIATLNPLIQAETYDLRLYPDLKERYQVMSVPCLIIEQKGRPEQLVFGKKQLPNLLELLA